MKYLQTSSAILLLLVFSGTPLFSQAIEDPGPFPAGWRSVEFEDDMFGQGTIIGRMYYPGLEAGEDAEADPSGGPYPLVGFQHGYLGRPSDYDNLCSHIAGWGFVVASTGTQTGLFPDTDQYARDTRSFLHWVEREAGEPASWLLGMTGDGDWAEVGHSMGGGTLSLLLGIEPRIRTIIGLQAAYDEDGVPNMRDFTGNAFQIAGEVDWLVPPATAYKWFLNAVSARRNIFYVVEGMGHTGCCDNPPGWEPLPGEEQARMHRRLVTGLLRAEMQELEPLYADLLGEGIEPEPVKKRVSCLEPPFWCELSGLEQDSLAAGLGSWRGGRSLTAWSLWPDSIDTRYGLLGIDPESAEISSSEIVGFDGLHEVNLLVDPAWSGQTLYLQGLAADPEYGRLSRTIEVWIP